MAAGAGLHAITLAFEDGPVLVPFFEDAVEAQNRMKPLIGRGALAPQRRLVRVERIVGHHRFANARQFEHAADVRIELLALEERARLGQIGALRGQSERLQDGHHAARGFRNRRVLHEQRAPDDVRLGAPGKREILRGRNTRRAEKLGFQVVIRDQVIDAPEPVFAERGLE